MGIWIIAYNNDVVVGARKWFGEYTEVPVMGYDGFDETIGYCENNSKIQFKVYNQSNNELIDISQPIKDDKTIFIWPEGILPDVSQEELVEFKWLFDEIFSKNHLLFIGINSSKILV